MKCVPGLHTLIVRKPKGKQNLKSNPGFVYSFFPLTALILLMLCALCACTDSSSINPISSEEPGATKDEYQIHHTSISLLSSINQKHQQAIIAIKALKASIDTLLAEPSPENLEISRQAWQTAHLAFLQSQQINFRDLYRNLYQLLDHPFIRDQQEHIPQLQRLSFYVDASPIETGFLDSIEGYPDSGIVMDLTLSIDAETLRRQHGITAPEEACLGFHPLEYFLWERQIADFSPSDSEDHVVRRRMVLSIIAGLLEEDSNNYFNLMEELLESLPELSEDVQSAVLLAILNINVNNYHQFLTQDADDEAHLNHADMTPLYIDNIQQLVNEPVGMIGVMKSIDGEKADSFQNLLEQLSIQSAKTEPGPEDKTLTLALISSLENLIVAYRDQIKFGP